MSPQGVMLASFDLQMSGRSGDAAAAFQKRTLEAAQQKLQHEWSDPLANLRFHDFLLALRCLLRWQCTSV